MTPGELEIGRLMRLHSALRQINQAIVRTRARDELFQGVCTLLVEDGGFGMAWIGWHDPASHRLVPVARAGDTRGYLQNIEVYADDRPEGRGPSGVAFRENRAYICNDIRADLATLPWRAELEPRGLLSSAAFPVRPGGRVAGTLQVYAERPGFFRAAEIALLTQVADDLAFGLENLARAEAHERTEAIARREQQVTRGIIDAMPGIFYLYDQAGRFLRWNQNFELVSGYSGDELAKLHPLDLFAGDDKPLLQQRIAEVFERGSATVEAALVSKDGTTTPYFFTGKRIVLDGAPMLIGVGFDISERKRAEEAVKKSEERYRTTLDTILEGCQLLGFDWRYLYLNPAAAVQNRRPNAELLGRTLHECWPGIEGAHIYGLLRRCMEERVTVQGETEFKFPDGSSGWFDTRSQPVPEGVFVHSVDITKRRLAEQELRDLNASLERKVEERTVDLEAARARAEAADRVKSAFLATMSHELRTPLNSILGFTGIVLKGMAGPLNAEQHKQLGMVQASARHLLELINDVLDISKIEAGQLEVRAAPFDVGESIQRVTAAVMPLAQKKALAVHVRVAEALPKMNTDRRRFEQILINLLNNAIKFTERGSVTVTAEPLDGAAVRVTVADTGPGMKGEDLARLFQPFVQIDSGLQRQHEGTGLGLAISRRLCELLGGTVSARSVWGEGSEFTVSLPARWSAAS